MNGETQAGARGIAPEGWHIPSLSEWDKLINHLGGSEIAAGKMKSKGTTFWNDPNVGATNSSGFDGRGSGEKNESDNYVFMGKAALYWSSNNVGFDSTKASYMCLQSKTSSTRIIRWFKIMGYSIRCIKDAE